MKISILCSSEQHPVNKWIDKWIKNNSGDHVVDCYRRKEHLKGGDLLFLISCSEIVGQEIRGRFKKTLVVHASDLPKGRGWSPVVWSILNGEREITVTLLEAEDGIDSGDIWKKVTFNVPPHALYDEINGLLFDAELELMDFAVENFKTISPVAQDQSISPDYYLKRSPKDSEIDIEKTIAEQFDLLRISDPNRYPAFFKIHGYTYTITLKKKVD